MHVKVKLHYKALVDLVELMAIFSTIAVGVDLYWSIIDFLDQANPMRLIPVILGLSVATVGMCFAIVKYHLKLVKQYCSELKLDKISRRTKKCC